MIDLICNFNEIKRKCKEKFIVRLEKRVGIFRIIDYLLSGNLFVFSFNRIRLN